MLLKKERNAPSVETFQRLNEGKHGVVQTYLYLVCGKRFSSHRRNKTTLTKHLWKTYVFGKQTIEQLSDQFSMDKRVVQKNLKQYKAPLKVHDPRHIHLVIDGTYFGERKEETSWCAIVARDPKQKEDLAWSFCDTEKTYEYMCVRQQLEQLGYTILSVTADGFSGIKSAFHGIPYQMCHVHIERLVIRGTTRNPQTEAGRVLLALVRTLHKNTKKHLFESSWTHEGVRQAFFCLKRHVPYLFTYKQNAHIPRTTNSLEGHFTHVKKVTDIHNGLSRQNKQKLLHSIFLASTISPDKKRLDEVL